MKVSALTGRHSYFEDFTVGEILRHARGKTVEPISDFQWRIAPHPRAVSSSSTNSSTRENSCGSNGEAVPKRRGVVVSW